MSLLDNFFKKVNSFSERPAFIFNDSVYSYSWLIKRVELYEGIFREKKYENQVVQLIADYSPESIAIILTIFKLKSIVSPITNVPLNIEDEQAVQCLAKYRIRVNEKQEVSYQTLDQENNNHPLINKLIDCQHPGLIIMSSGSTGKSKAILHDASTLILKQAETKNYHKILSFLLFDHIGGLNTLFNALNSGNTLIIPTSRSPINICQCIEVNRVDTLITSPTFLNLLLISNACQEHDLTCLKQINFGSEPMSEVLLDRLKSTFPGIRFTQAYGLSEIGVIKTKCIHTNPLYIQIDDAEIKTRICDGMLEIKSISSMMGYLNYPNPFTEDGWFKTGDLIEEDDHGIRIIGRQSDIINIGGEKVYPSEIENILMSFDNVLDVTVIGQSNPILGNIIHAIIKLDESIKKDEFLISMRKKLSGILPKYKIPQKISFVDDLNYNRRLKKTRLNLESIEEKNHA
jgi:acyl-coenzyme A synthetase/AMP-(fatty) acid ligase